MTRDKALKLLRLKIPFSMPALVFFIIFGGYFISGSGFSIGASPTEKTESFISPSPSKNVKKLQVALIKNLEKLALIMPANEIGSYLGKPDGIIDVGLSQALEELLFRAQLHAGKDKADLAKKFNKERLREIQKYMKDQGMDDANISLIILSLQTLLNDPSDIFRNNYIPNLADIDDIVATTTNPNAWMLEANEDAKDPDYYVFPPLSEEYLKRLRIENDTR